MLSKPHQRGPHVLSWHPVGGVGPNQAERLTQKPSPHPSSFPAIICRWSQRSGALLSPGRSPSRLLKVESESPRVTLIPLY